jgi:hypothetical protein
MTLEVNFVVAWRRQAAERRAGQGHTRPTKTARLSLELSRNPPTEKRILPPPPMRIHVPHVRPPMPPTFAYILALMVYIGAACVVWGVAIVLAFPQRTRALAKKIAAGMAGSFPGVFLFQLISVPLLAVILLTIAGISHFFRPPDAVIIVLALVIISIPTAASLLGFYTGWRVAWELAAGRSAREFLQTDRVLGPVVRFLRRRLPFLGALLRGTSQQMPF